MKSAIRWNVVLYLTAIFMAGSISGWVLATRAAKDKAFAPLQPNEIAASLRDRIHSKLNLTPEQAAQVDGIIERSCKEIQGVHGDCIKRLRQGISNRNSQINALLTPEQQRIFQAMEKERHGKNKDGRRARGSKGRERDDTTRERGEGPNWNELKRERVTNSPVESLQPKGE